MNWFDDQQKVRAAAAEFPAEFGLHNFPGDKFRINLGASYVSGSEVFLYADIMLKDGTWASFCKGTPAELRDNIVKL